MLKCNSLFINDTIRQPTQQNGKPKNERILTHDTQEQIDKCLSCTRTKCNGNCVTIKRRYNKK